MFDYSGAYNNNLFTWASSALADNPLQQIDLTEVPPEPQLDPTFIPRWRRIYQASLYSLRRKLSELTLSQWMYLFAILLLISSADQDVEAESTLVWVGVIAGIGLARELWHVFNRIWHNILGKGLVFVLYAATANFAVAVSALKINEIAGIEPFPFVFTIGFATLLMLPFWLLVASVVFFSIALIAGNIWLLISILLRFIRIKVQVHWEDKSFVFLTMLLRIVLIPYVIMSTFFVAVPYAEQIELFKHPIAIIKAASNDQEKEQTTPEPDEQMSQDIVINDGEESGVKVTIDPTMAKLLSSDEESDIGVLDKLIAGFIYRFETYPNSVCKKKPEQHSMIIDENFMLLVERDDSELGYHFSVGPCVGRFEQDEQADAN